MILGLLLGDNAGSHPGTGDVWVAENRPIKLACKQECCAFQEEKQRAIQTLILLADINLITYLRMVLSRTVTSSKQQSWWRKFLYLCT